MAAKHTGNRLTRRKAKKRIYRLISFSIFLLLVIIASGVYFLSQSTQKTEPTKKSAASSQVSQSSQQANSSTTDKGSSKDEEQIKWVKQDNPVKIPILMYHAIHDMDPSEAANAGLIVSPETFESHLKALKEAGYYTLSPDEAYKILTENVLPETNKKVVWLTFDDSLADFYSQAFPLLQKYQMRATNNVITGFVENGRADMLTLEQIKEMKEKGMSFEDHTVNHPDLSAASADSQTSELQLSKQYLDNNLAQTTTTVAYPSGRYTDTTMQIAQSLGYKMGLTTNNDLASAADGLLSLNRVRVNPTTTAQDLLNEIAN